uniref:Uncharacterized protein n=1 Tax=Arundo donax TaxID=35708 RepID=A0A0A8Y7R4_ARUDO
MLAAHLHFVIGEYYQRCKNEIDMVIGLGNSV